MLAEKSTDWFPIGEALSLSNRKADTDKFDELKKMLQASLARAKEERREEKKEEEKKEKKVWCIFYLHLTISFLLFLIMYLNLMTS